MRTSVIVLLLLAACGGPEHRGEPSAPPMAITSPHEARGEHLFFRFCNKCHPGGAAGIGPSLNDRPLPVAAIRTQIRKGVGAMPTFSDDDISDRDLGALVDYVRALRDAPAHYTAR